MEEVWKNNGMKLGFSMLILILSYLYIPSGIKKNPERIKKAKDIVSFASKKYP